MQRIQDRFPGFQLNTSDRAYCDHLHSLYRKRFILLSKLYAGNTSEWLNYQINSSFEDPFPDQTKVLRKYLEDIEGIFKQANATFILAVERHFRDIYGVAAAQSYTKRYKDTENLIQSYEPIIIHLVLDAEAMFLLDAISQ